jgi:Helix-turn-helix domain
MIGSPTPQGDDPSKIRDEQRIQALLKPRRLDLLSRLESRSATPEMLRDEIDPGGSLDCVVYDLKVLLDADLVEVVESRPAGGSVVNHYRANPSAFIDPVYLAPAGVVDLELGAILDWSRIGVDEVGMGQLSECLRSAREQIFLISEQSRQRHQIHGRDLTPLVVGVVALESAPSSETPADSDDGSQA